MDDNKHVLVELLNKLEAVTAVDQWKKETEL